MVEFPHTIVGAAIAAKVGNPYLALPMALLSHFVLDMVPHWNPHLNKELKDYGRITSKTKLIIALDVFASLIAGFFIAINFSSDINKFLIILAGCFLAVLPDVAEAPHFFWRQKSILSKKLVEFQSKIQFDVPIIPGLITQAIVIFASFWWLYS